MRASPIVFLVALPVLFKLWKRQLYIHRHYFTKNGIYRNAEQQLSEIEGLVNQSDFTGERKVVDLPAGSVNGLQAAIEEAGPNGIVNVKSGLHIEDVTVNVNFTVQIIGEEGAVIESNYPAIFEFELWLPCNQNRKR